MAVTPATSTDLVQAALSRAEIAGKALQDYAVTNNPALIPDANAKLTNLQAALTGLGYGGSSNTNRWGSRLYQSSPGFSSINSVYNSGPAITLGETDVYGTAHLVIAVNFKPDAIIFTPANIHQANPRTIVACAAVCPSALGDLKYDDLFAAAPDCTFNGGFTGAQVPPVPKLSTSASFIGSDVYPLTAGTEFRPGWYLVAIRECAFYPTVVGGTSPPQNTNPLTFPAPYFVHTNATGWADTTQPFFYLGCGVRDNKLHAPLGATPTGGANCSILGFRIRSADGVVHTIAYGNTSLAKEDLDSALPRKGGGWPMLATAAITTKEKPVEFMNMGQAGQVLDKGVIASRSIFPIFRPTYSVVEFACVNNLSTVTVPILNTLKASVKDMIDIHEMYGIKTIFWDSFERNTSTSPWLAPYYPQDQWDLLNAYVAEYSVKFPCIQTRQDSRSVVPRAAKMIGNGDSIDYLVDGIHQSAAGRSSSLVPRAVAVFQNEIIAKW